MSTVAPWLQLQAQRLARLPCLEDALLGVEPARYVFYRLRYVYVRALLRCAFRILELVLLARLLPAEALGAVLAVRSVLLLGDSLLWGALESLRSDVRELARAARLPEAVNKIRAWLALTAALGLALCLCSGLGLGLRLAHQQGTGWGLFVLVFVFAGALRWAPEALARTYHAGIYGLKRVYRPGWSLLLVDGAELAGFALFCWWFGPWGAPLSLLAVGLLRAGTTWWFTRRVYAQLKLTVRGPRYWWRALKKRRPDARVALVHGLANLVAQVDALLILGLLAAPGREQGVLLLAALFHVVAPLQSVAVTWTRLFYFDFKRLEGWGSAFLLKRFDALLTHVAVWAVLPAGLITWALMAAFWRGPYVVLALELCCLGWVRSWLSLQHLRAYSLADYRYLRKLFLGMLLVVATTPVLATLPAEFALGGLVLVAALGLWLAGRSSVGLSVAHQQVVFGVSLWLSRLLAETRPVRLGLARVDRRLSSVGKVAHTLLPGLQAATVGRLYADTLVWFEVEPKPEPPQLLGPASGCLKELKFAHNAPNGKQAWSLGMASATWARAFSALPLSRGPHSEQQLLQALQRDLAGVCPELRMVVLQTQLREPIAEVRSQRALRRVILDATRGVSGFRPVDDCEVLALAPGGTPRALVVAPRRAAALGAQWKSTALALVQRTELMLTLCNAATR